jgi:hypothetical protein
MTIVSPRWLLFGNLYPLETLKAAGNAVLKSNAPMTLASFAAITWSALLYALGILVMLLLAKALDHPGSIRRVAFVAGTACALFALVVLVRRPETVRYYLIHAYGWIPLGVGAAVPVLFWRFQRRSGPWSPPAQIELAASIVLAIFALKTYAVFFMFSHVAQIAAYVVPLVALFLARLHLSELPRRTHALGMFWLAFLATAGAALTWTDARAESAIVAGPGGVVHVRPREAAAYQRAVEWIVNNTAPKEAILIGPQLTTLYVLSGRRNPLPHLSLLPGALPTEAAERDAIRRLETTGVRLAILDRREFRDYGHGAFGVSFQRILAAWVHEKFDHVVTIGDRNSGTPVLDVWRRKSPLASN